MAKFPFYGRGVAFPFRINPATGGVQVIDGSDESSSVALQYLADDWKLREDALGINLIADSIAHILLTVRTEHDTLPEFGSRLHYVLFEPITERTYIEADVYFWEATERWEHRAKIPIEGGSQWSATAEGVDQHYVGVMLNPSFITNQDPANLVYPFVTTRQARLAEYPNPPDSFSTSGTDYDSRYFNSPLIETDGTRYLRLPITRTRYIPQPDDRFRVWDQRDTWLLVAFFEYGQRDGSIRYWDNLHECYIRDCAERGEGRACLNPLNEPENATMLRMPSSTRLLMEYAG